MNQLLLPLGRIAGFVGFFICLASGLARLAGVYGIIGFEMLTLLQAGIGAMVFGCFCLLLRITDDAAKKASGS
jgi:hypothetical protein